MTRISSDMTVLDIVAKWEKTQAVFKCYDEPAGECICCNALFETVEQVCEKYTLPLEDLLADLEAAAHKQELFLLKKKI